MSSSLKAGCRPISGCASARCGSCLKKNPRPACGCWCVSLPATGQRSIKPCPQSSPTICLANCDYHHAKAKRFLKNIVKHCDALLRTEKIGDYDGAVNGLQAGNAAPLRASPPRSTPASPP